MYCLPKKFAEDRKGSLTPLSPEGTSGVSHTASLEKKSCCNPPGLVRASGVSHTASLKTKAGHPATLVTKIAQPAKSTVGVNNIELDGFTRPSAIKFHVARVAKPLAFGVCVVDAGNRVVLQPESVGASYIENIDTNEKMELRLKKGYLYL